MATRPPLPPFTRDTTIEKVRLLAFRQMSSSWSIRLSRSMALAVTSRGSPGTDPAGTTGI
jgi:nuclear transport factor 2 (NTF2) superfamily protein